MTLEVRVSGRADCDADAIFNWLSARSEAGAHRWYQSFLSLLEKLPGLARGCSVASEARMLGDDVRQVLFKTKKGSTYRVLFVLRGETIHIIAVRGSGQAHATPDDVEFPCDDEP